MFTIFATVMVVVTALVYYFPEKYEVRGKLLVKVGREFASISPAIMKPQLWTIGKQMKEIVKSEREILTSGQILERVVDELGVDYFSPREEAPRTLLQHVKHALKKVFGAIKDVVYDVGYALDIIRPTTEREDAVLWLQKSLRVESPADSNIIVVTLSTPDPERGTRIVDHLMHRYLEHRVALYKSDAVHDFFVGEVDRYKDVLRQAEDALARYKRDRRVVDIDKQRATLFHLYDERKSALDKTQAALDAARARVEELRRRLAELEEREIASEESRRSPMLDGAEERLIELQLQRAGAEVDYDADDRHVKGLEKRIAAVERLRQGVEPVVVARVVKGTNPTFKEIQKELAVERAEVAALRARAEIERRQVAELEKELVGTNDHEIQLRRLARELQVVEGNYVLYETKREEARVQGALDQSRIASVTIAAGATSSFVPVKKLNNLLPRKIYYMLLGAVGGLLLGILYSLMVDYLTHTVRDDRDARRLLRKPVLGSVPSWR